MSVSMYFGVPRCGKTTMLAMMVYKAIRSKRYENVYCNIDLTIPGYTRVFASDIGSFRLHHGLLFIDEAAIEYDSRNFKGFDKKLVQFFMMHGHFHLDIIMFSQFPDAVDKKIRAITTDCYMVYKPPLLGRWFTRYFRIPYGIVIPDNGDKLGEIVQGYKEPPFLAKIFSPLCFRPRWYKYFDSYEEYPLPELPKGRVYGEIALDPEQVPEVLPVDLRLEDPSSSSSSLY